MHSFISRVVLVAAILHATLAWIVLDPGTCSTSDHFDSVEEALWGAWSLAEYAASQTADIRNQIVSRK